jgi:hypothetical protein
MPVATPKYPLDFGANQLPRRSLGIDHGHDVPVTVRDVIETPFFALTELRALRAESHGDVPHLAARLNEPGGDGTFLHGEAELWNGDRVDFGHYANLTVSVTTAWILAGDGT